MDQSIVGKSSGQQAPWKRPVRRQKKVYRKGAENAELLPTCCPSPFDILRAFAVTIVLTVSPGPCFCFLALLPKKCPVVLFRLQ